MIKLYNYVEVNNMFNTLSGNQWMAIGNGGVQAEKEGTFYNIRPLKVEGIKAIMYTVEVA